MSRRTSVQGSLCATGRSRVVLATICCVTLFLCSASFATDDKADSGAKPMASEELNNGATLDVVRLERRGDGLVFMQYRFRNPGKEQIKVLGWDEGRDLPG